MSKNNGWSGPEIIFWLIALALTFAFALSSLAEYCNKNEWFNKNVVAIFKPRNLVKELETKISDLEDLNNRIVEKKDEASTAIKEYTQEIEGLKNDTYNEALASATTDFNKAIQNKRINSNISLIQRKIAYSDKLKEIEFRLNMGAEELRYLGIEARTDLKMAKVLDKIDELIGRIDTAIKNYKPYAENFVIDKNQLHLPSTEDVWRQITEKKGGTGSNDQVLHQKTNLFRAYFRVGEEKWYPIQVLLDDCKSPSYLMDHYYGMKPDSGHIGSLAVKCGWRDTKYKHETGETRRCVPLVLIKSGILWDNWEAVSPDDPKCSREGIFKWKGAIDVRCVDEYKIDRVNGLPL